MTIDFSPGWALTDELDDGLDFNVPVLLSRETGEAYKADDIIMSDPSMGSVPAVRVVDQFLREMKRELTAEETTLLRKVFLG